MARAAQPRSLAAGFWGVKWGKVVLAESGFLLLDLSGRY